MSCYPWLLRKVSGANVATLSGAKVAILGRSRVRPTRLKDAIERRCQRTGLGHAETSGWDRALSNALWVFRSGQAFFITPDLLLGATPTEPRDAYRMHTALALPHARATARRGTRDTMGIDDRTQLADPVRTVIHHHRSIGRVRRTARRSCTTLQVRHGAPATTHKHPFCPSRCQARDAISRSHWVQRTLGRWAVRGRATREVPSLQVYPVAA